MMRKPREFLISTLKGTDDIQGCFHVSYKDKDTWTETFKKNYELVHVIEYSEMKRISDLYDRRLNNHQKAYMNLEVDFKELQAQADKLAEALTQANELMEKLINGDKFHQEYLLKTQAMADKALGKLK